MENNATREREIFTLVLSCDYSRTRSRTVDQNGKYSNRRRNEIFDERSEFSTFESIRFVCDRSSFFRFQIDSNCPGFVRSSNINPNPSSFVHTTPFTPAEARTISLNNLISEQTPTNENMELIKPKECTLIDCKTITMTAPINYSVDSIGDISKTKKRPKK